jgi:hypothetical protein
MPNFFGSVLPMASVVCIYSATSLDVTTVMLRTFSSG